MHYLCLHLHNTVQLRNYEKEITELCLRADSCWPQTAEACFQSHISSCGICDGHIGAGTRFFQMLQFSPITIIPSVLHIHLLICHQCNLSN